MSMSAVVFCFFVEDSLDCESHDGTSNLHDGTLM